MSKTNVQTIIKQPSKWLRIILPLSLIIVWIAAGSIGGPYFGKIEEVSTNNLTDFLPASAEATEASTAAAKFRSGEAIPAIILVESSDTITPDQLQQIAMLQQDIGKLAGIDGQVSPPIPSQDGQAVQIVALVDRNVENNEVVEEARHLTSQLAPPLTGYVTGPSGFAADLTAAFAGIDGILLATALIVVLLILLIVYRSPILPFIVLLTSIFALSASILLVWWLAKWDIVQLNGQVQGILFILVIGAATDYSLLYVARFRESLRHHQSVVSASWAAIKGSYEPIIASGGTVIAGLLCLLLSDLNSNKFLGPVSAIGIIFAMAAALTFLPSALMLIGRKSYWPLQPTYDNKAPSESYNPSNLWGTLASQIDAHARWLWLGVTAILAVACLGITQLQTDGVAQSDIISGSSQARDGQEALSRHFPGGSGSPVTIITNADNYLSVVSITEENSGISSVAAISSNSPSGTVPLGANKLVAGPLATVTPTIIDNQILLQATLKDNPDSLSAEDTVIKLRQDLHQFNDQILVGGQTATSIDTRTAAIRDRNIIIPAVLLVITIILMILLRAITAPLVLILTTILSFGATLGIAGVLFKNVLGMPGADPSVPLYAFVFLVALGIDYNIFLMTRAREETMLHGNRQGILRALVITGGVITSAGLVLAATFAALAVIPILFLLQIAFIVAFGVLLDTFVVRSILVPALIRDIGPNSWWPSALKHKP